MISVLKYILLFYGEMILVNIVKSLQQGGGENSRIKSLICYYLYLYSVYTIRTKDQICNFE